MFKWLLNLFTGGGIIDKLTEVWLKKKDSAIESERIQAEVAKHHIEARLAIRLATAGFWEMRLLTFIIAAPFAVHAGAVMVDTVFNWMQLDIPAAPAPFDEWEGAILLSFFGIYGLSKGVTAIAQAVGNRRERLIDRIRGD